MGQFFEDLINTAVPSFINRLTEYVKGGGGYSEHFSFYSKKNMFTVACAV